MAKTIEKLVLPRLDWYEQVRTDPETGEIIGRINKDALIENFNAIEAKLNELMALDAFEISQPDFSKVSVEDVDINKAPDNHIVNMKTLCKFFFDGPVQSGLVKFPVVLDVDGYVVKKLSYYDLEGVRHNITNVDLEEKITDGAKIVWLMNDSDTIDASNSNPGGVPIGIFENNQFKGMYEPSPMNMDILQPLAEMSIDVMNAGTCPHRFPSAITQQGRLMGYTGGEKHRSRATDRYLLDQGRT